MKLLVFSDLHGAADSAEFIVDTTEREKPEKVLLLGDILYHGPRNDVPPAYAPKKVIEQLSLIADRIICVRGNCEAEVDQMVLPFPCMSEEAVVFADGAVIFMTHGHIWNEEKRPSSGYTHFFFGHTHVRVLKEKDGIVFLNPGSITIPKMGQERSYAIWQDGRIRTVSMEKGTTLEEI